MPIVVTFTTMPLSVQVVAARFLVMDPPGFG
jgi:hypothetical protein